MSTSHVMISIDHSSQSQAPTTPLAKALTRLLFLVSILSLQGCFLTARVWKEDHPNGIREAKVECMPVSAARNGTELIVTVRIITTMATRGQQEFSHGKDTGYTDRNFTAGDLVFLKSRPQRPCVPDDRVWKEAAAQLLSVRVWGKGEKWEGSLQNGVDKKSPLELQRSKLRMADLIKPDVTAIRALGEQPSWLGRSLRVLMFQPLFSGRQVGGNPVNDALALPIAFRELDGPINYDLAGLITRLVETGSQKGPLNLNRYTLIIAPDWLSQEVPDFGPWEVNLEAVAAHGLRMELREFPLGEIPESAANALLQNAKPAPVSLNESAMVADVWEAIPRYGAHAGRIALTPLAVVGDAVIIVTAPVWGIIGTVLFVGLLSTNSGASNNNWSFY